jgi:hypothetical protein
MKSLLIQMYQAMMISMYKELALEEIMAPSVDCHENRQVFFFIDCEALVARAQGFANECYWMAILLQYDTNTRP